LESLLAFFATFVLESALVRDIMRWDMTVLRESAWYQEILQEGEARGRAEGEAIGEQRAQVAILLKLLSRQLGIDSAIWRQRLEFLSREQLDRLTDDLFDFSTEADLVAWMAQHGK
jgi:predicted transposase YdaD